MGKSNIKPNIWQHTKSLPGKCKGSDELMTTFSRSVSDGNQKGIFPGNRACGKLRNGTEEPAGSFNRIKNIQILAEG